MHGPQGVAIFPSGQAALAEAEETARKSARLAVEDLGAEEPQLHTSIEKHLLPDAVDDNGLLKATVTVEAIGRPSPRH